MIRRDIILLQMLICVCSTKVCWAANCDLLQDEDDINPSLAAYRKWEIKKGNVYTKWNGYKYDVVVTCKRNFHLMHYPNQTCIVFQIDRLEYDFNSRFKCIEDKTSTKTAMVTTEAMSDSVPVTSGIKLTNTLVTAAEATTTKVPATVGTTTQATITAITPATARKISMHVVTRETEGGPVMYIAITAVGMVLIIVCIIVGICWKRSRTDSGAHLHQICIPSVLTSNTNIYDTTKTETGENTSHLAVADHIDFNYAVAMDLEGRAENFDDNEYNTLHVNEQNKPAVQTNTSYDEKDLYSHTPRYICHAHSDSETYSHLTSDGLGLGCSAWKDATDNIYNKLSIDERSSERNIKDSACPDPDYDHTFIHRDEFASIENDTYAHVTDNLV